MPGAGRIRTLARAGLLAIAALAVVFAPAALPAAGSTDPADLAAAVLAPSDAGPSGAWRPVVPEERAGDLAVVVLAAVAVVAAAVPAPARRRTRPAPGATRRTDPVAGHPPSDRAPPLLVVV